MKKKILSSFALTVLSSGLFFVFNFAIAKILGANEYGKITYYLSFVQLLVLFIGINHPALYMGSKILKENTKTFDLFFSVQTFFLLLVAVPGYVVVNHYIQNGFIVSTILIVAYLLALTNTIGLEFNAQKDVTGSILYGTFLPRLLMVVIFSGELMLHIATAQTYLVTYVVSLIVVVAFAIYTFRPRWLLDRNLFARLWKFYLLGLIGASFAYIAQIAQKEYGNYSELASLGIALLIISGLEMIGRILIKYALPKLHEAWKNKNINAIQDLYHTHTFVSSSFNIPILIFLLMYAEKIAEVMGEGYRSFPTIFAILSVGYLFDLLTGITGTILRTTEHEHLEIYNEVFRFATGISLLYLLHNYPHGIPYAISGSVVIYNIVKYIQVFRLFRIKPIRWRHLTKLFLMLGISSGIMYTIVKFIGSPILSWLTGGLFLVVYYIFWLKIVQKTINLEIYK